MHHDDPTSTPPESDDAWIEKLLRERSTQPPGPHDDANAFSARVLAALPPPAAGTVRRANARRTLSIALGAALGAAAVAAFGGESMLEAVRATSQLAAQATDHIQQPSTVLNHVLAGLSFLVMMFVALRRGWRRLLT